MKPLWLYHETDVDTGQMSQAMGINTATAKVLAHRGIRTKNSVIKFLRPLKSYMHDPYLLKDGVKGAEVTLDAIKNDRKITVYGDYDVDGVSSVVILVNTIEALGGRAGYYIPGRAEEGYGLNVEAIHHLARNGTELIITCDNGISSIEEIRLAKSLGIQVVVIDHHEPGISEAGQILPEADAIINPKQVGCEYPFKLLCAAAISYKFAELLYKIDDKAAAWEEVENEHLIFAALATVCDIVSLTDENRIITINGLAALNRGTANTGLNALLSERDLLHKTIGVFDVGFIIGPCINASGRLDVADLAAELFLLGKGDGTRARDLAKNLSALNEERKKLTTDAAERMGEVVGELEATGCKVYVMYDEDIPESIAGIVAGRIKDKTHHPVIVLTATREAGLAKGSARSVRGYNLFEELSKNAVLFTRFGGHEMAAGLTMPVENIPALRQNLNDRCSLTDYDLTPKVYLDGDLNAKEITMALAREIGFLQPFGSGNHEPVFAMRYITCDSVDRIGKDKRTLRFSFSQDEFVLRGIAFGKMDSFTEELVRVHGDAAAMDWLDGGAALKPFKVDIAFNIDINEYNGYSSIQLKIVDLTIVA
ncbi:MAG: single-stranded-DNA-specific exonuclease RecJ [Defluviitaleaceae bacterium]|nr:single-stranded-DNA-specific exonuclease RecJ [Defluviitaleaceae bacterium]